MMKPKRKRSKTSAETSNYIAEVQSRQCTITLKKSPERKHAHPQDVLGQKTVSLLLKKKKIDGQNT